jgi:hypothetical protein
MKNIELQKILKVWPDDAVIKVWDMGQGGVVEAEFDTDLLCKEQIVFAPKDERTQDE